MSAGGVGWLGVLPGVVFAVLAPMQAPVLPITPSSQTCTTAAKPAQWQAPALHATCLYLHVAYRVRYGGALYSKLPYTYLGAHLAL